MKKIYVIAAVFLMCNYTFNAQILKGNFLYGPISSHFGSKVDISGDGNRIVCSSRQENDLNGTTRVFDFVNDQWIQVGSTIIGVDQEALGTDIAISDSGNRIVISSLYYDSNGVHNSGRVRVFDFVNDDWVQIGSDISQPVEFNTFGHTVAMNKEGNRIAVGASQFHITSWGFGFVAVYELINNNWVQLGQNVPGVSDGDAFGQVMSFSENGTRFIAGSLFSDSNGSDSGQVRVFEFNETTNSWFQVGQNLEGNSLEMLGIVAISDDGNRIAITPKVADVVKIYDYDTTSSTWIQVGSEIAMPQFSTFGSSLDFAEDKNLIGIGSEYANENAGELRLFHFEDGDWVQRGNEVQTEEPLDRFGASIALSNDGNTIVGGAPQHDAFTGDLTDDRGLVLVFTDFSEVLSTTNYTLNEIIISPNPTNNAINLYSESIIERVFIFNSLGQKVLESSFNSSEAKMDVSNLNSGLYIIKVFAEGRTSTYKIIKN